MDQRRAPLFEKMMEHERNRAVRFHVPGHLGKHSEEAAESRVFEAIRRMDFTEVGELDDLHHPAGVIAEAQHLAAEAFGADETCFLVNGSTAGNQAMILGTLNNGELLLVQRNCHKSVIHGLMLAGAAAVFLAPEVDEASGIMTGVKPELIEEALKRYPQAKGVLLTNPNYFGMGVDLEPIARFVHRYDIPLLIDEAHGAHYGFHEGYPPSALSAGADAVVQSTHKMLTAMTMGAMLHVRGSMVDRRRIRRALGMLQSSSPSYPLMASLDLARRTAVIDGERLLSRTLDLSRQFRKWAMTHTSFACVERSASSAFHTLDPLKLTIRDTTGTLTGFELKDRLGEEGILAEMADKRHVLLHLGLFSEAQDIESLQNALLNISVQATAEKKEIIERNENIYRIPPNQSISSPVSFRHDSGAVSNRRIPLSEAVGHKAADMVVPYPPGIPILYPGETIGAEAASYLHDLAQLGAVFQGLDNVKEYGIPVIDE